MTQFTLHTGCEGDETEIIVDWFDHNNERFSTKVKIAILPQDKPRTLAISIDGKVVYNENRYGKVYV